MLLCRRRAKQISRMVRNQNPTPPIGMELPPHFTNRESCLEKRSGSDTPQAANELRLNNLQLALRVAPAVSQFTLAWVSISWRATLDRVKDVHVGSGKRTSGNDFVQQLTRGSDKGLAKPILIGARVLRPAAPIASTDCRHRKRFVISCWPVHHIAYTARLLPAGLSKPSLARPLEGWDRTHRR